MTTTSVSLSPARHVPRLAMDWLHDSAEARWRRVDGAMVFADISGFTALSERLAERGRIGAEELVETLSRVFTVMLDAAALRGGQLIKFGGDALLILFDQRDTGGDAARQAAAAAVEMRAALRRAAEMRTSVGRLHLSVSIGVHAGAFDYFLVGHPHRELIVLGPGVTSVLQAEATAQAGEILLSLDAAAALPRSATTQAADGHRRLLWRTPPVAPYGRHPRVNDREAAVGLLPRILFGLLDGTRPDPGHRISTIGFLRFSGTDALLARHGPHRLADDLDQTLRIAQAAFEDEDVALLCVDGDRDGGKLFVSSGVPVTSQDDEGRMLRAARALIAAQPPLPIQIGVNRGHVFAAEVGSPRRAGYSAMGDTTNTAARICAKAQPGEILVHPSVLEHARTRYEAEPVGPFTFKGKRQPQWLYRLGAEIGPRDAEETDDLPLVGRAEELAQIGRAATIRDGRGATIEVIGPVGVGKTRLLDEAIGSLPALPTIRLHAEPYGAASYRVFRDPLRALLRVERGEQATMAKALLARLGRSAPHLRDVAALIGAVAQVEVAPSDTVQAILPAHRADRIADAIVDLLAHLHPRGLMIVMEDAQWADPASIGLLERLAAETHQHPWLLLVSQRESDSGAHVESPDLTIELQPLADEAIRALAVVMTETAPLRPDELALVVARADGSPLFAREMIRAGQELGSLEAVPSSLQGAVAAQVDVLDPATRRALAYASVLGRSFRGAVLDDVLGEEGVELSAQTRERLARFLAVDDEDRWQFRHAVLSEVVYDGLGYNLRARLHLDAGFAVERLSSDLGADADTLALHFSRGGRHDKAFEYSVLAAARSEAVYASTAAVTQLNLALESARRLSLPAREVRALWMRLADARENAGILDGALDALRHAGRLHGEPVENAYLWLRRADVRERMGSFSPALRDGARASAAVSGQQTQEAAIIRARELALIARVRMRQEKASRALTCGLRAAEAAEACGDSRAIAQAEVVLVWAQLVSGMPERAMESGHRALRLFRELDDGNGQARMANNLGAVAYYASDWAATVDFYGQAIEAFTRVGDVTSAQLGGANLGEVLVNQGRLDEAEPLLVEARRNLRASGHAWGAAWADLHLGRLLVQRGDLEQAERILAGCVAENRAMGSGESVYEASIHLGHCLVAAGRPAQALDAIDAARVGEPSLFDASAARVRALAHLALDEPEAAAVEVRAGVAFARERGLTFDLAGLLQVAATLGVTDVGDADEAQQLLDQLGVAS